MRQSQRSTYQVNRRRIEISHGTSICANSFTRAGATYSLPAAALVVNGIKSLANCTGWGPALIRSGVPNLIFVTVIRQALSYGLGRSPMIIARTIMSVERY